MDATNFVEKISQLVPNKQDILRNTTCSEEFADIYIQDLSIKRKATHTDVSPNFPVIDLIFNYDLSKLRIQVYSFNDVDDVAENDQFIYVGWVEAFLLAILKETGEIVATDWANPCSIVSYIAKIKVRSWMCWLSWKSLAKNLSSVLSRKRKKMK